MNIRAVKANKISRWVGSYPKGSYLSTPLKQQIEKPSRQINEYELPNVRVLKIYLPEMLPLELD